MFPSEGEFFGLVCSYMNDHSYRTDIFECTASDEKRVVGIRRTRSWSQDEQMIFHRAEWKFEDVTALLPALGFCNQKQAEEIASSAISKATGAN
jgi:hypothetical protein